MGFESIAINCKANNRTNQTKHGLVTTEWSSIRRSLTSNMSSICCRVMYEPSAKVRVLSTVLIIREMWTSQISKNPILMRMSWSSCDRSTKPGTRLANSTTLCMEGVTSTAKCCHITIFCCSRESAAEPVFEVGESSLAEPVWYSSRLWISGDNRSVTDWRVIWSSQILRAFGSVLWSSLRCRRSWRDVPAIWSRWCHTWPAACSPRLGTTGRPPIGWLATRRSSRATASAPDRT